MSPEFFLSLFGLAFAASWTPGPNNSMLASSGATFGLRASMPHVLGVALGFPIMIFLVGLGLGEVFRQSTLLQDVLRYAGAAMILWIAWKIAWAAPPGTVGSTARPLKFIQAAGFQWVNPKGWVATIAITSQFVTAETPLLTATIVAAVFVVTGLSSTLAWVVFGQFIGRMLSTPAKIRLFNLAMAALLVGFLIVILTDH